MWDDEIIRKIVKLEFPDFSNIEWEVSDKEKPYRGYFGGCLRHGTPTKNIESILENRLDIFNNKISYRSNDLQIHWIMKME